ncbi:hypothetical protein HGRIS_007647 [Hohenbuehelia grisea]|uniref:Rhodanese domain-containing protein n=1 Tax=Hohenbuehelia grisea TaxID=104357 RepID=A0ABR3J5V0_9AGAR
MFRTSVARASRLAVSQARSSALTGLSRPALQAFIRFESSQSGAQARREAFKKAQKLDDDRQRDWDARVLTYDQVKSKTQSPSPDAYIIDVREPDEVIQGSIPSSVNLPLSVLGNALHTQPAVFKERYGFEKPKLSQEIVFYCRSGKRSASACDVAKRNGYTNLFNYEGSWLDWVERDGKKSS